MANENSGGGIKKPSVEIAGGTLEPARLPLGKAVGVRWTKKFAKGGAVTPAKKTAAAKAKDMTGRAMKRKTADAKGRAMKKTVKTVKRGR